jgi:hypothetical protein
MEVVLILVVAWRMDSFREEAMCHEQEIHGVGMFQDYASQGLAVHDLISDPGARVYDCSSLDGFYCVSHRFVMSPLWDIITLQRFMMTRVARWML